MTGILQRALPTRRHPKEPARHGRAPRPGTAAAWIAMLVLLPVAVSAWPQARPGLLLEYRFDGTAADTSGGGHNGRVTGNVTWNRDPAHGGALFDGSRAWVDAGTNLPDLRDTFAIECWIKPARGQRPYADVYGNHENQFAGFALQQDGMRDNVYYFTYGTGSAWVYSRSIPLLPDVWQHVAVVRSKEVLRFYVNGVLADRRPAPLPMKPGTTPLTVGLGIAGQERYFRGTVAELRVWDRPCPIAPTGTPREQRERFAGTARVEAVLPSRWGLIRPGAGGAVTLRMDPEYVPPAVRAINVTLSWGGPSPKPASSVRLSRANGFSAAVRLPSAAGLHRLVWRATCPTESGPLPLQAGSVSFMILVAGRAEGAGGKLAMPSSKETVLSRTVSLNGDWLVAIDPGDSGRAKGWWSSPAAGARKARVPGIIQEAYPEYHGVAWYWRRLEATPNPHPGGRTLLRFEAVDYLADVWLNGQPLGRHEGGETPFEMDATQAVKPGPGNLLAVRVLNPSHSPVEGMTLNNTPRRAKVIPYSAGASYDHGGLVGDVDLAHVPAAHITDVYAMPDWRTGVVRVEVTLRNAGQGKIPVRIHASIAPAARGGTEDVAAVRRTLAPGRSAVVLRLAVPAPRLWDVRDPFLYRVTVGVHTGTSHDERSVRVGFRDFRLADGAFRLNGRRIYLRSAHTVNAYPVGQQIPLDSELFRKDVLYMKGMGFNGIRFIWGGATRAQLDICDEMGLMVYDEHAASNPMEDGPHMTERFDRSIAETIRRDRNHPSVVIWGLLNETPYNAVFRHAAASLPLVRSLDQTRMVMLNSGRWDGQRDIGSMCNPGAEGWDGYLGGEGPGRSPTAMAPPGGYTTDMGDVHAYPRVPHSAGDVAFLRNLGRGSRPVFLSEYGIGSAVDLWRVTRRFEQMGHPDAEDARYYAGKLARFLVDWQAWKLDEAFADPQTFFAASLAKMADQRRLGLDAIRANPGIIGHNVTGMMDHVNCGEGIFTLFRDLKPGATDAFFEALAPLRLCLFAEPRVLYRGSRMRLEAVLANEDALPAGSYPVRLQVIGPGMARVLDRTVTVTVPASRPGAEAPLAIPVFDEEVTLDGPPGAYRFTAAMQRGGVPTGGVTSFHVEDPAAMPGLPAQVVVWGEDPALAAWLTSHSCAPKALSEAVGASAIVVGGRAPEGTEAWSALLHRVEEGATAVFLSPEVFRRGDDPVAMLPLERKGALNGIFGWLYLKDEWAKTHPFFAGLPAGGLMDTTFYRELIPDLVFTGQDPPEEAVAGAIKASQDYASGLMLAVYRAGKGRIVLNTLRIQENLGAHPAAERLLRNLLRWAAESR